MSVYWIFVVLAIFGVLGLTCTVSKEGSDLLIASFGVGGFILASNLLAVEFAAF
ncbi:hypothetical protein PQ786_04240 [Alcaligenes faecalis]